MPDPSSGLLSSLGINLPSPLRKLSPEEEAMLDRIAKEKQAKDPAWQRYGRDLLIGGTKGLMGSEFEPGAPTGEDKVNALTQLVMAGLPFISIRKMPVYHGSPKVFERFNPEIYDKSDVLGWMTHFAEDPNYAKKYAEGYKYDLGHKSRPNIIAAEPQAKNVLDLVDPNNEDLATAMAALDEYQRADLIDDFKKARSLGPSAKHLLTTKHYPEGVTSKDLENIPARFVAQRLRLDPEQFEKTPFDAIRYRDVGNKSWAIPAGTPIKSAYGDVELHPEQITSKRTTFHALPEGIRESANYIGPGAPKTEYHKLYPEKSGIQPIKSRVPQKIQPMGEVHIDDLMGHPAYRDFMDRTLGKNVSNDEFKAEWKELKRKLGITKVLGIEEE